MERADPGEDAGRPRPAIEDRPGFGGLAAIWALSSDRLRASRRLRASLLRWAGVGLVTGEAFAVGVAQMDSGRAALVAGLATLAWWLAVTAVPVIGATQLATPDGGPVDRVGVPNGLTLLRAYSCPGLLACAFAATPHRIGFILWATVGTVAAVLDLADGYIARTVGPVTRLGQAMDPMMDAAFFSMAAVGNVPLGIIPAWLGGLMLARYLAPLLFGVAFQFTGRRPDLSATTWGKRNTVLTGATLAVLLVVRSAGGPTQPVAAVFAVPLAVTTLLHFAVMVRREREAPVIGRRPG